MKLGGKPRVCSKSILVKINGDPRSKPTEGKRTIEEQGRREGGGTDVAGMVLQNQSDG